jgi:hypothetical protein
MLLLLTVAKAPLLLLAGACLQWLRKTTVGG